MEKGERLNLVRLVKAPKMILVELLKAPKKILEYFKVNQVIGGVLKIVQSTCRVYFNLMLRVLKPRCGSIFSQAAFLSP